MPDLKVEQPEIAEAPAFVIPNNFEDYEAHRQASHEPSADLEDEPEFAPTPDPEPAASETAKEDDTTSAAEPQPETAAESDPAKPQEPEQGDRNKKGAIPQSRLDEVTRARREAERKLEAEQARTRALEEELAILKTAKEQKKTPDTQPEPAKTEEKPSALPERPRLPSFVPAYMENHPEATYEEAMEAGIEAIAEWQEQKRTAEQQIEQQRKKDEADAQERAKAERAAADTAWINSAKEKYPDFEQAIARPDAKANGVMIQAIRSSDDGVDIAYFLANHPEEAERITNATNLPDNPTADQINRAFTCVNREFGRIAFVLSAQSPTGGATETAPSPAPPPVADPTPVVPGNTKPAVTRAPKPPSTVEPRSSGSTEPRDADSFEEYERRRIARLPRR